MSGEFGRCLAHNDFKVGRLLRFDKEIGESAARVVRQDEVVVADVLLCLRRHILLTHFDFLDDIRDGFFERLSQLVMLQVDHRDAHAALVPTCRAWGHCSSSAQTQMRSVGLLEFVCLVNHVKRVVLKH